MGCATLTRYERAGHRLQSVVFEAAGALVLGILCVTAKTACICCPITTEGISGRESQLAGVHDAGDARCTQTYRFDACRRLNYRQ